MVPTMSKGPRSLCRQHSITLGKVPGVATVSVADHEPRTICHTRRQDCLAYMSYTTFQAPEIGSFCSEHLQGMAHTVVWQGGLIIMDAKYGSLDPIMELERHLASRAAAGQASDPLDVESAPAAAPAPGASRCTASCFLLLIWWWRRCRAGLPEVHFAAGTCGCHRQLCCLRFVPAWTVSAWSVSARNG